MRNDVIETEEYKGYHIDIIQDLNAESPRRDMDNMGLLYAVDQYRSYKEVKAYYPFHDDYIYEDPETDEPTDVEVLDDDIVDILVLTFDGNTIVAYDVDDDVPSRNFFGYLFATRKRVFEWLGFPMEGELKKEEKDKVRKVLEEEIELYNTWGSGDVYGYVVRETEDSVWGFYGSDFEKSGLLEDARGSIDYDLSRKAEAKANRDKDLADVEAILNRLEGYAYDHSLMKEDVVNLRNIIHRRELK